jgi:heptose I phosphotransferase
VEKDSYQRTSITHQGKHFEFHEATRQSFYIDKNDTFRTPNWRDKVVLIDLHRLSSHTWTSQIWKIKDLAQLIYSSEIEGVDDRDRLEFWRCYRDLGPKSSLDRILLYVIKLKWGRYRRHNLKKKAA